MEALALLFAAAFASATLFPGFSEAGVAGLVAKGNSVALVVAVATAGNTLGSVFNWWLGRYLTRFSGRRWFPVSPEQLEKASERFRRYGTWCLLLAWLPVIGDPLTLVAGVMRVHFGLFLLLVGLGKGLRYLVVALAAAQVAGG